MQQIVKIEIISKMYQLFRAIARNNDAKDADDTVSDSLLQVLESEEKFNELPTKSIIALIIAISKKKLIDKHRKSVRDKNAYQSFIEQFCSECSNDEYEEWFKKTLEMVYQAMNDFKTEEIELIRWHYFDDMTFKQIGARMKKSPEAVQKQHERLLKRIRDAVIPPPRKKRAKT